LWSLSSKSTWPRRSGAFSNCYYSSRNGQPNAPPAPPPTPEQEAFDEQHRALVKRVENIHLIFRLFHDDPELARVVNTSIQQEMDKENQKQEALRKADQRRAARLTIWVSILTAFLGALVAWLLTAFPFNSVVPQLFGK